MFLGDLVKDHTCTRVRMNDDKHKIYLICLSDKKKANSLMNSLKELRISFQRLNGQIVISKSDRLLNDTKKNFKDKMLNKTIDDMLEASNNKKKLGDDSPYWTIAQGWSTCSLKCGGGTMTLHRICVRPSGQGECKGSDTIIRSCNPDPCPGIVELKTGEANKEKTAKPIVRVLPFSQRYQSYTVSLALII